MMASVLRRSAAHARELLIPRHLDISEPARQHLLLRRHLAASATTSTRCFARPYAGNTSSRTRFGSEPNKPSIPRHRAITEDGVTLDINNSVVHVKIVDPYLASYGLEDLILAIGELTQATMSTELGKIALDRNFIWKDKLNNKTMVAINYVTTKWGIKVLHYDVGDVSLPSLIMQALEVRDIAAQEKLAQNSLPEGGNSGKSCTRLHYQELQRNISKFFGED